MNKLFSTFTRTKCLFLAFFIGFAFQVEAQSFNNEYPVDQEDLKMLFQLNKLEVFKFPFTGKSDSSINILLEYYSNQKLVAKKNLYVESKPILAMMDDPATDMFPILSDTGKQWLRFYIDQKAEDTVYVTVKTNSITKRYHFGTYRSKLTGVRAFDSIPEKLIKKEPLAVLYGSRNDILLTCPGDATVKDIVKLYDFVLVFYAEPFKLP